MKMSMLLSLILIIFFWSVENVFSQVNFTGPELLGRPTNHSVTVNVVANAALQAYFEYGTTSGVYTGMTGVASASANEPIETVMDGLAANTLYYYRMVYSTDGGSTWINRTEHSFHTQRPPGSSFIFTITSDSHFGQYGGQTANEKDLYALTLQNAAQDHPDFHIDCGDTFAMDPSPLGTGMTVAEADNAYFIQRPTPYLGAICHSIPYFFVLGNHENEEGWNFDDVFTAPDQSLALVGMKARKKYFPNPVPDDFYSGNVDPLSSTFATTTGSIYHEDYYAWEWGDALFVVIDPFHYSMKWPSEGDSYGGEGMDGEVSGTRWDWSLGIEQYLWLKSTLENSHATFKFVFSHQVAGGSTVYGRGGIGAAPYFEWGGKNADGTWGWDTKRPASAGWDLPIHQLMVEDGVSIYFHGHDHEYAYETLDGIVYLECAKPDDAGYTWQPYSYGHNENLYPNGLEIQNSGHIRVTVSPDEVKTEYVRAYLPGGGTNRTIAHTVIVEAPYTGPTHDLTLTVSPSATGTTSPSVGTHTYQENDEITITATPASGYIFSSWTGDVANPNSASTTVTMDNDKTVTANFVVIPSYNLTMSVDPSAGGTTTPAVGIHSYSQNTVVNISATAATGYVFDHWSGGATGSVNPTSVTMDAAKSVTAVFVVNSVTSSATPSNATPAVGQQIVVSINVDMTHVVAADSKLGSFTGSLVWDPAVLAYAGNSGLLAGFTGAVNATNVGSGRIDFNGANATGTTSNFVVFQITFDVVGAGTSALNLEYSVMAAATSFTNLLPILTVTDGQVVASSGILGDINDDDHANSTDALVILSCDVGINVSQFCPMNCGDVNSDGLVNSTDALIILSYDVGMSVPFTIGQAGCQSSVAPCDGCNP
jgi:uncharacterized repeat protein (TIGR02543 family)